MHPPRTGSNTLPAPRHFRRRSHGDSGDSVMGRGRNASPLGGVPVKVSEPILVLWDGECGVCREAAGWLENRTPRQPMLVLPYQSAPDPPVTPELRLACAAALHVVLPGGSVLAAGRAVAAIADVLGWRRLARLMSLPPFSWIVETSYGLIARNRRLLSRLLGLNRCVTANTQRWR